MKKLIMVFLCLILIGCTNNISGKEIDEYNSFVSSANNIKENSNDIPFDIDIYYEKIFDEIIYRVIIDNPKRKIMDIKAIAVHNYQTKDIYPSIGIFEEPLHLDPHKVDLDEGYAKGIVLTGYIDYDGDIDNLGVEIKLLIEYNNETGKKEQISYKYQK